MYVAASARGRGIGRALLSALIRAADEAGLWTLQAGIFPENRGSLAIHRRCGFRLVGRRERIGQHQGVWRNVLLLERRSRSVGQGPRHRPATGRAGRRDRSEIQGEPA